MGSSPSNLQERHVVIVGGGYAGTAAANHLRGKCKLTLIDSRECMHHCVGSLRACVEPGYAKKIFIPYVPAFGDNFKRGTVTRIDVQVKKVVLDDGEEIQYDYLIIATGSTGSFPAKLEVNMVDVPKAVDMYDVMREKIKTATDIVVIGGGPVGVELSGEICTDLRNKNVTLIHSKSGLVAFGSYTDSFRKNIYDQLVALGVTVLLDQKVINLDEIPRDGSERCVVKTDKGESVEADLVLVCIGLKTNTEAYANALEDKMDDRGCLKVNEHLQLEGLQDVFVIGDCSTADQDAKMAYTAGMHADIAARNIQNLANEKPLLSYKPPGPLMIVPIGRNAGVMQYGSWVLGSFTARTLKSKDLFTSRFWKDMRQKVPAT